MPSKCVILHRHVHVHKDVNEGIQILPQLRKNVKRPEEGKLGTVYFLLSYIESCNSVLFENIWLCMFTQGS